MIDGIRVNALRSFLRRLALRSRLGREQADAFLVIAAEVVAVKAGTDFVRAGRNTGYSCLLAEGLGARVEQLEDGRRQIISLHIPGDLVDLHSLLLPRAPATFEAICDSVVVRIPHAALRDLMARWPDLTTALWRDTLADAAIIAQAVARLGRRDAYARIAHFLCEMTVRHGQIGAVDTSTFRLPMTQEQLGDALGLTSVHINRTLRALREDGLVLLSSNRVEVLDWPGLQRAGAFDPIYLGFHQAVEWSDLVA